MPGNPARDLKDLVGWRSVVIILFVIILVISGVLVLLVLTVLWSRCGVRIRIGNGHARPAENGNSSGGGSDQFAHRDFLIVNFMERRFSAGVKMVAQDINRP
ncbi:hypothetical protein IP81_13600 [Novosphingobium sp. AAP83]|nr:hypothetical protein IP81_13600 [Novosphingobium sp. AAP83]